MGTSVEIQLIAELEAALEQQQTAVNEGHAAIRDTIRELQQALSELEQRENSLTQTSSDLTGRAVSQLGAVREAVAKAQASADDLEAAREKIAELERQALARQALEQQLADSEGQRAQLQQQLEEQAQAIVEADKTQKRLRKIELVYKEASDALQAGQAARRRVAELEATVAEYKQAAHAEHEKCGQIQVALDAARSSEAQLRSEVEALTGRDVQATADRLAAVDAELESARQWSVAQARELDQSRHAVERLEKDTHKLDEELAARASDAEKWKGHAEELEQKLGQSKSDLEELRMRARDTAESERSQRAALEKAGIELDTLRPEAARAPELEAQVKRLESESRQLAERLHHSEEELADERSKGTKSQLAAQLADALHDREAAHAELQTVRRRRLDAAIEHDINDAAPPVHSAPEVETFDSNEEADPTIGNSVLRVPTDEAKRLLGEIFVNAGIITETQLGEALTTQKRERPCKHLGSVLVAMGHAEETQVAQAIARQRGLEFLPLGKGSVDVNAARLISARLAEKHLCIPVREKDGELLVAMENPLDLIAIEDVELASERRVRPAVSTPTAILAAIAKAYTPERQRT